MNKDITGKLLVCGEDCSRQKQIKSSKRYECFAGSGQGAEVVLGMPCTWGFRTDTPQSSKIDNSPQNSCPYALSDNSPTGCLIRGVSEKSPSRPEVQHCDSDPVAFPQCARYFHHIQESLEVEPFHEHLLFEASKDNRLIYGSELFTP